MSEKNTHARLGWFDRFASTAAAWASRAWFFAACVALVLLWAPSYVVIGNVDTWQLIINTATTIVTFLMVALLQNTQARDIKALHAKLDALAEAQADLMEALAPTDPTLTEDIRALRAAVGLEERQGST